MRRAEATSKCLAGTAQAILLGVFVLMSGAHAQPRVITVPTKFCTSKRPNLTTTEFQVWKDLCAIFNDGDEADRVLADIKESAEKTDMDLSLYAKLYIKLALALECERGKRRACQLLEERQ